MLAALPAEDQRALRPVLTVKWYPFEIGERLDAAIVATLGGGRARCSSSWAPPRRTRTSPRSTSSSSARGSRTSSWGRRRRSTASLRDGMAQLRADGRALGGDDDPRGRDLQRARLSDGDRLVPARAGDVRRRGLPSSRTSAAPAVAEVAATASTGGASPGPRNSSKGEEALPGTTSRGARFMGHSPFTAASPSPRWAWRGRGRWVAGRHRRLDQAFTACPRIRSGCWSCRVLGDLGFEDAADLGLLQLRREKDVE